MQIKNCTPHSLDIHTSTGEIVNVPPSGIVVRLEETRTVRETIPTSVGLLEVSDLSFGEVEGLPPQEPGVLLVVSALIAQQTDREDVYSPGPLVRDPKGKVVGCRGLTRAV